jgi:cation transporter-like permease
VIFFLIAWAYGTRMHKPLTFWKRILDNNFGKLISATWKYSLVIGTILMLISLETAVFGYLPGFSEDGMILNATLLMVLLAFFLYDYTFIAGFASRIHRPDFE